MELEDEQRWRDGLRQRGKEFVRGELQRRYGGPDDVVLDIVFEPPFPTRAFCARWCAEEDNRLFSFSKNTVMIVAAMLVLIVGVIHMVQSWDAVGAISKRQQSPQQASSSKGKSGDSSSKQGSFGQSGSAEDSNSTTPAGQSSFIQAGMQQDGGGSSTGSTASSSTTSSSTSTPPTVCSYIPYPTALCPQSGPSTSTPSAGYSSSSSSSGSGASASNSAFGTSAYTPTGSTDSNQPISQGRGMSTGYGTPSNYNPQKAQ